jgi:hypothetical protein
VVQAAPPVVQTPFVRDPFALWTGSLRTASRVKRSTAARSGLQLTFRAPGAAGEKGFGEVRLYRRTASGDKLVVLQLVRFKGGKRKRVRLPGARVGLYRIEVRVGVDPAGLGQAKEAFTRIVK